MFSNKPILAPDSRRVLNLMPLAWLSSFLLEACHRMDQISYWPWLKKGVNWKLNYAVIIIKQGRRLEDNDKSKMSFNWVAPPSLRSKRFQSSHCAKVGVEAKEMEDRRGRGKGKKEFTSLPSPFTFIPLICSRPNFLDTLARKRLLVPGLIAS